MMNQRIRELAKQARRETSLYGGKPGDREFDERFNKMFAELIVGECAGLIHLECKDFANGNCFHDDALWKSVTTEYGKNKERGFDPIGMSIHFDKLFKKHFGIEE